VSRPAVRLFAFGAALSIGAPALEPTVLSSQSALISQGATTQAATSTPIRVPFGPGERFDYDVRLGSLKVGSSQMEVRGVETVRGRDTWHTAFWLKGGTFFYKVNDLFESWIDVETLSSLRFVKLLQEGDEDRAQLYEIYPERLLYVNQRNDKPTRTLPTVRQPLDEGSFLYFVRTLPLTVGESYDFSRYFIPDRNPVTIRVLRKERVTVPAGTFNAIVVQPVIKTKGIFSQDGHAEVWLSDDSARMVLQLKSRLAFGSLNLYLTSYALAKAPPTMNPGN
jgi:Protein of unknown function (DUF3108)